MTTGVLSVKSLETLLKQIRSESDKPFQIRPTQLIIGDREIAWWAHQWDVSFDQAKQRIVKWAGI